MTNKPHMTLESGEKLYEGEYGITRDGERVGPIRSCGGDVYPWRTPGDEYTDKGEYYSGGTNGEDIIARAVPAISLDTLENLTTPLGLLDDATRKALEDHGGPYEFFGGHGWDKTLRLFPASYVHRVKRQPKVETVKRAVCDGPFCIGYCAIDKINGEYDLSTVRPWVEAKK